MGSTTTARTKAAPAKAAPVREIDRLSVAKKRAILTSLVGEGLSPETVGKIHNVSPDTVALVLKEGKTVTAIKTTPAPAKATKAAPAPRKAAPAPRKAAPAPKATLPYLAAPTPGPFDATVVYPQSGPSRPVDKSAKPGRSWKAARLPWNDGAFRVIVYSKAGAKPDTLKWPERTYCHTVSFGTETDVKGYVDAFVTANGAATLTKLHVVVSVYRNSSLVGQWGKEARAAWTLELPTFRPAPVSAPAPRKATKAAPAPAKATKAAPAPAKAARAARTK